MKDNKFNMSPREWRNKHLTEAKALDQKAAQKIVWKKLKDIGLSISGWEKAIKDAYDSGRGKSETKETIDPKKLGPMQAMFKSINYTVEIDAAMYNGNEFVCVITLNYGYTHPSGSNGYRVAFKYTTKTNKWQNW